MVNWHTPFHLLPFGYWHMYCFLTYYGLFFLRNHGFVVSSCCKIIGCMLSCANWVTLGILHAILLGLYIDTLHSLIPSHTLFLSHSSSLCFSPSSIFLSHPRSVSLLPRSFSLTLCISRKHYPCFIAVLSTAVLYVQSNSHPLRRRHLRSRSSHIIGNFLFLLCCVSLSLLTYLFANLISSCSIIRS
jgi:hypothetical protein